MNTNFGGKDEISFLPLCASTLCVLADRVLADRVLADRALAGRGLANRLPRNDLLVSRRGWRESVGGTVDE